MRIGTNIQDRRPEQLRPGDVLLVGRRARRVGLLAALEERLSHRPDLLAARLLIDGYHQLVRSRFVNSGLTIAELHRRLAAVGCDKTAVTVRSWVTGGGIMAPRDLVDLRSLNTVLDLGMSDLQLDDAVRGGAGDGVTSAEPPVGRWHAQHAARQQSTTPGGWTRIRVCQSRISATPLSRPSSSQSNRATR